MNRKMTVLFAILAIIMIASGCGGGGGGSGRYTIPTEIPTPGTGGGGSIADADVDSLIASAWEDFAYGAYSSATSKFNQALSIDTITDTQKVKAYNGLGWSLTRATGLESGYSAFTQSSAANNEAKIGLASALIQRGDMVSMGEALRLLEEIGLKDLTYVFASTNPIEISNAEAHAMLSWCYFWRNNTAKDDYENAKKQIYLAIGEDPSTDGSVGQIYKSMRALGLPGL
ncbi:MAG: hypothetical protein EOM80_11335 [Erysipelotrichia bacterium]|nr:hypothetical protein [Erysipelotrichia bacterium]